MANAADLTLLGALANGASRSATMAAARRRRAALVVAVALTPTLLHLLLLVGFGVRLWGTALTLLLTSIWGAAVVLGSTAAPKLSSLYRLEKADARARRLGPYTLSESIGRGGMGEVYKASHALLRRPTAVKVIRAGRASELALARFEREAQLTSQLTHPCTVHVYDYGVADDGTFYYAMEYIDGLTLWQLVKLDGPQCPGRVVALLAQVCASLAEAHALGLIHRDVKPDNVLVCARGLVPDVVKVLDFGLARAVGDAEESILGTPQYMAPEAISPPFAVDARADIYAIGALAYFLLTGTPVFTGAADAILGQHLRAVPQSPSSRLGRALPADLESLILRCLAKDPAERPSSALALREALLATAAASTWTASHADHWWKANEPTLSTRIARLRRTVRRRKDSTPTVAAAE